MVEILLIKINYTKNLKGITYAQKESRSETFADDTSIFIERSEHNLRNATRYITQFHSISGLACNLDKTVVIPIGTKTNIHDQLCTDLGMKWSDTFTILGFVIDSKLKNLDINFKIVRDKIKSITRPGSKVISLERLWENILLKIFCYKLNLSCFFERLKWGTLKYFSLTFLCKIFCQEMSSNLNRFCTPV